MKKPTKKPENRQAQVVRVSAEAAELLRQIAEKTRGSKSDIASDAILFAAKHVQLTKVVVYDYSFKE